MKKHSGLTLLIFTLCLMSSLSVLYWSNVREKLAAASSAFIQSVPLSQISTSDSKLALTFDLDGHADTVESLLNSLKNHNVKATFFVTGTWLDTFPEDAKTIARSGHELGNHTDHHPDMTALNEKFQTQELLSVHTRIQQLTGITPKLFRPPYGAWDNGVIQNAKKHGYLTTCWNIDSQDWKDYTPSQIADHICSNKNLGNGSIILMHGGTSHTAEALDLLIPRLQQSGYQFATVSQLIEIN